MSQTNGKYGLKVRKHLRTKFFSEPHPTKLLNELLEKHYGYRVVFKKPNTN